MAISQRTKLFSSLAAASIVATLGSASAQSDEAVDDEPEQAAPDSRAADNDIAPNIHEAPCDSGPPAPIFLNHRSGNHRCYGGTPGPYPVGHYVLSAYSGGYWGVLHTSRGPIWFAPGFTYVVDAVVDAVEITPPRS